MNYLRIFAPDDSLVRELVNVGYVEVFPSGALHVTLVDADEPGARLAEVHVAPGFWQVTERWTGEPPAQAEPEPAGEPEPETITQPDPPAGYSPPWQDPNSGPGVQTFPPSADAPPYPGDPGGSHVDAVRALAQPAGDDPAGRLDAIRQIEPTFSVPYPRDPLYRPDAIRVHEAMQILCACDQIRCTVVLNPSTVDERETVAASTRGGLRLLDQPEPLQRCVREAGHPMGEQGHVWVEGGWPYGIAEHHPKCPRWPAVYNRHLGPCGYQFTDIPGPLAALTCCLPYGHAGEHAADVGTIDAIRAAAMRSPRAGIAGAAAVLAERGFPGASDALAAAAPGWDYTRPDEPEPIEPGTHIDQVSGYPVGRVANPCGTQAPSGRLDDFGAPFTCDRPTGHEGQHTAVAGGGDLLHW